MKGRLLGLDALRGIAALAVALLHLNNVYHFTTLSLDAGDVAVDFFFMLSGFVMARTYESRLQDGSLSPMSFLRRRYTRLWFTMAVGSTMGFAFYIVVLGPSSPLVAGFAFALTLVLFKGMTFNLVSLNSPAWSVFYELLANFIHGFALARCRLRIFVLIALVAFGLLGLSTVAFGQLPLGTIDPLMWPTLSRTLASYLTGVIIFRKFGDNAPARVPFWLGLGALPTFAIAANFWSTPYASLGFIAAGSPLMMFAGMRARIEGAAANLASIAGKLSFPLYAVHLPIFVLMIKFGFGPLAALVTALGVAGLWLVDRRRLASRRT